MDLIIGGVFFSNVIGYKIVWLTYIIIGKLIEHQRCFCMLLDWNTSTVMGVVYTSSLIHPTAPQTHKWCPDNINHMIFTIWSLFGQKFFLSSHCNALLQQAAPTTSILFMSASPWDCGRGTMCETSFSMKNQEATALKPRPPPLHRTVLVDYSRFIQLHPIWHCASLSAQQQTCQVWCGLNSSSYRQTEIPLLYN